MYSCVVAVPKAGSPTNSSVSTISTCSPDAPKSVKKQQQMNDLPLVSQITPDDLMRERAN